MRTTRYTERVLIIVPAADVERANLKAKEFDSEGGEHTFTVSLSPTGEEPATHYVACTAMRAAVGVQVRGIVAAEFPGAQVLPCSVDEPEAQPERVLGQVLLRPVSAVRPTPTDTNEEPAA
jgi:hypothetical protein